MGWAHRWGNGLPKDVKHAAALYKTACDGGEPSGCTQAKALTSEP
jgi:TPR repeat protein